ncbi:hypothetical protein [Paucisalibacillus globulus]|uniref:hypothetical protein n=1 Tax=Paucisalibacillus globulus TaxID=351095 RepID=UPI000BB722BC|nr:hypothetical protein [Paucisalibacillus globulus]
MKNYFIYAHILLVLLLVGCAENPALIGLKEEEVPQSTNTKEGETETKENNAVSKPPSVQVHSGDKSTYVALDVWCWKEESLCSLEPNPLEEQLYGMQPLLVEPDEVINISISTDEPDVPDHIFYPDIIDLTQVRLGEEKEVEINNRQILAPMETGRYYYSLKLQWDGELVGQAYYVFSISVR